MKNDVQISKCLVSSSFALAIAVLAWLPSQALAQEKGAQKLMKIETVGDLQTVQAGDILVMSCPKCKDSYATVVKKSFKGMKREELETVVTHLCPNCDTKIVAVGPGKSKKDKLVHTCKSCGSDDAFCCVMKRGGGPTSGMEEKDEKK